MVTASDDDSECSRHKYMIFEPRNTISEGQWIFPMYTLI